SNVFDRIIDEVNAADADLILFTGDYADRKYNIRPAIPTIRRFLQPLKARLGKFGISGNHDTDLMAPYLPGMGVTPMDGVVTTVAQHIEVVGLPGVDHSDLNREFLNSVPPKDSSKVRI